MLIAVWGLSMATTHVVVEVSSVSEGLVLAIGVRTFVPFPWRCSSLVPRRVWAVGLASRISARMWGCSCCLAIILPGYWTGEVKHDGASCLGLIKSRPVAVRSLLAQRSAWRVRRILLRYLSLDCMYQAVLDLLKIMLLSQLMNQGPQVRGRPSILLRVESSQFLVNGQGRLRFVKFSPQAGREVEVKTNAISVDSDLWVVEDSAKWTVGNVILGKRNLMVVS